MSNEMRDVVADSELQMGIFVEGAKYHIRTPTYQYIGTLVALTGTVFVFKDTATVYETGNYKDFYAGKGKRVEKHEGAEEMIIDRGGTVLHRMK
jgi:hypothetical protein